MPRHSRPPGGPPKPDPRFGTLAVVQPAQPPAIKGPPKRDPSVFLPNDDPLILIEQVDAAGGVDGTRARMNPTAAEAFRVLCRMPPIMRTLPRLSQTLVREWGKSPNRKTLETWSAKFQWQELLRVYDGALARYRLWYDERQREQANMRQAKLGRKMYEQADAQMEALFGEAEQERAQEQAEAARAHQQVSAPEKANKKKGKATLNGLHALAFAAKTGFEMERVALGLPTIVTSGSLTTENLNVTAEATTLDDWRRRQAEERGLPMPASDGRALPAPRARVEEADLDELPEGVVEGEFVEEPRAGK